MNRLESYTGGFWQRAASVQRPATVDELCHLVASHDPQRGAITLRATGHSLHTQALGAGMVVSLEDLPHRVRVTETDVIGAAQGDAGPLHWTTAEVTGWTPWEAVVRASLRLAEPAAWGRTAQDTWVIDRYAPLPALPRGNHCAWERGGSGGDAPSGRFMPYVLVSSGRITTGGSLSGDGLWRFSSVLGRESDSVVWLDLLRADGTIVRLFNSRWGLWDLRTAHPGREPAPSKELNDRWFDAVIGGFGLLGCIVNIKFLLLELDEGLDHRAFTLSPPGQVANPPGGAESRYPRREREFHAAEQRLERRRANEAASGRSTTAEPPGWPRYPHAGADELGKTGAEIVARALTWMWETDHAEVLFDTLQRHRQASAAREAERGRIAIPRRTSEDTVACFGLLFANSSQPIKAVIGNVAYGTPPADAASFLLWDREYGWKNTSRVLRWRLLPWAARLGEWFVYHHAFAPCIANSPTQNYIPEFAFFMEGHEIAQVELDHKPRGIQQMWSIPIALEGDGGRDVLVRFLDEVHRMSHQIRWFGNAVRVQVCDLKCIPPGRALLSSAPGTHSIAVTITIEGVRGYRRWLGWGSPVRAFRRLTRKFVRDGVKVHLTKNVYVHRADLRHMYGPACQQFLAIKHAMDPRGVWGSSFLDVIARAAR